jgi:hypothetical protein
MFWTFPLSTIRIFSLYTRQWYMSYRFVGICHIGLLVYVIQVTVYGIQVCRYMPRRCQYMSYRLLVYVTQVAGMCHTDLPACAIQVCRHAPYRFAGICHTGLLVCHTGLLVYVIHVCWYVTQVCWYVSHRFAGMCHTGLLLYVTQVWWYMPHRFVGECHTGLLVYVTQVWWYMSHRFGGICHTGLVVYVIQVCCKLASYQQTCMTYSNKPVWHIPLLCVHWKNSWWLTEELSETCRVLFQK